MGDFAQIVIGAIEPFVGSMAASTCVRATALSVGKTSDELGAADLPALDASIRRLLGPVAPENVLDGILAKIREAAQ